MVCVICKHGEAAPGTTTVTLQRESLTLVVKDVPARVCETCGEDYLDEAVIAGLRRLADDAARAGVQVEVGRYVAA